LVIKLRSCALYTNQCHCIVLNERVQTEYLLASADCLAAELIFDMASIAMMPLIARFVWLLIYNPSAEDLHNPPLSVVPSRLTCRNNLLIINE
jgi:hypothetical protein